ncbi:MAG TPA: hypothetical protein VLM79_32095, partial [Kofleriaceae bacterium]|nr:hypothetical protein [Kofleriaceae bacterium]
KTCAQANAQCGAAGDGCGNIIQCGSCPVEQACVGGTCTSGCTPKTCAQLNYNCGEATDGCGDVIQCGACNSPQTCGGGGVANQCGGGIH